MAIRLVAGAEGFEAAFETLLNRRLDVAPSVGRVVADILADVRCQGDGAIIAYTARFDRLTLTAAGLRLGADEIAAGATQCDPETAVALDRAAARIEAFHRRQMPDDMWLRDDDGIGLGYRWRAIRAVGLYVPGGSASYPSSVLMNAIPAKVAGVERLVMTTPTRDGKIPPPVLRAAVVAGIDEIYRIGGAQAIAGLAYGTDSLAPVDMIAGPGNAYVAAAKQQLFGRVGIDMIAGPSEITVVSDGAGEPAWIAADLLAQAEHDADAQAILITDDGGFAARVEAEIEAQLSTLPRAAIAGQSWRQNGAIIVVDHLDRAPALIDRIAPEHLELAVAEPEALAARIRHAGAIFLGRFTPEAVGDYIAGPSHVLPTAGSARFSSGLSVFSFLRRTSLIDCDRAGLNRIGPTALCLAEAEGLAGHARSLSLRLPAPGEN